MKRIFLIEDEPLAMKRLRRMVLEIEPSWIIAGHADSVESAIEYLKNEAAPDLIFMDIQLADGISFNIFDAIEINSPVIFTTAYDEYALKAFKVNSIDYLLKPIDAEELKAAMLKFSNRTAATLPDITAIIQEIKQANKYRTRFLLTKGDALIPVQTEDIVWVGAESKRVFLMQKSGNKTTFPFSLDELQSQLNPADFFRINRSVIACRTAILKAELHFNGKIKIQLLNWTAEELFVSREKASDFKDWWGS